jgi:Ca-activated chloride channel family protein
MNDLLTNFNQITLENPTLLWLIPVIALICLISFFVNKSGSRISRGISLIFRALALGVLVFALCTPQIKHSSSSEEVLALFDLSESMGEKLTESYVEKLLELRDKKSDAEFSLIPFAGKDSYGTQSLPLQIKGLSKNQILDKLEDASKSLVPDETNIYSAISSVISSAKPSSLLLASDGFETVGDVEELLSSGIPTKIYPLIPEGIDLKEERLDIASLYAPLTIDTQDQAQIKVGLSNSFTENKEGQLEVFLDDKKLFSSTVEVLASKEKVIEIKTPALEGGLKRIKTLLKDASGKLISERHRWISIKNKEKTLLISDSEKDARHLARLLSVKGYALESIILTDSAALPKKLTDYGTIIVNNVKKDLVGNEFLANLKTYVNGGGGLLLVGGDKSYGLGGYINTPLEEISPVKFIPPQTKKKRLSAAVVMLVDKSGSMGAEGKILAAKRAAMVAIQALKPDDEVGLIGFDAGPFTIIELQRVSEASIIAERRLMNLTPNGNTNLLPALSLAKNALSQSSASRKHIIVLSDGQVGARDSNYSSVIQGLNSQGITVSAVAMGSDADVPFMQYLSTNGRGAFYQTSDPNNVPEIFLKDIKVSVGEKTLKENQEFPVIVGPAGASSVEMTSFPPVLGFVETLPKKGSQMELITRGEDKVFPILSSWEVGKGKVIAFTPDANGRWSAPWLPWPSFVDFWSQIFEKLKRKDSESTANVQFDLKFEVKDKKILLDLSLFDNRLQTNLAPQISAEVKTPDGKKETIVFKQTKKGRFFSEIENVKTGDYRLNINYEKLALAPLAITITGEMLGEKTGQGINSYLLSEIASATGGKINPSAEELRGFKTNLEQTKHVFFPFLILAFFLVIIDVLIRELEPLSSRKTKEPKRRGPVAQGQYQPKKRMRI